MNSMKDSLRKAVEDFYKSLGSKDKVRLIESGEEASVVAGPDASESVVINGIINSSSYSSECSPGAGIRLGAADLLRSSDKKAVVYISQVQMSGLILTDTGWLISCSFLKIIKSDSTIYILILTVKMRNLNICAGKQAAGVIICTDLQESAVLQKISGRDEAVITCLNMLPRNSVSTAGNIYRLE